MHHDLLQDAHAHYAACECSWLSDPERSADRATAAWREHVVARHADAAPSTTEDLLRRLAVEVEVLRHALDRTGRPSGAIVDLARAVDAMRTPPLRRAGRPVLTADRR